MAAGLGPGFGGRSINNSPQFAMRPGLYRHHAHPPPPPHPATPPIPHSPTPLFHSLHFWSCGRTLLLVTLTVSCPDWSLERTFLLMTLGLPPCLILGADLSADDSLFPDWSKEQMFLLLTIVSILSGPRRGHFCC